MDTGTEYWEMKIGTKYCEMDIDANIEKYT